MTTVEELKKCLHMVGMFVALIVLFFLYDIYSRIWKLERGDGFETCGNYVYNPWASRPPQSRTDQAGGSQPGEMIWGQIGSCGDQNVNYNNTKYNSDSFLGGVEQPIFYDIGDADADTTYFYNSAGAGTGVQGPSKGVEGMVESGWKKAGFSSGSLLNQSIPGMGRR